MIKHPYNIIVLNEVECIKTTIDNIIKNTNAALMCHFLFNFNHSS